MSTGFENLHAAVASIAFEALHESIKRDENRREHGAKARCERAERAILCRLEAASDDRQRPHPAVPVHAGNAVTLERFFPQPLGWPLSALPVTHREFHASRGNRMNGPLEWFGAIGSIVAAAMIAADFGRRWTGWAFVLFVAVSVAWIASGLMNSTMPLVVQNGLLLAVNAWGVWQYLLSPKKKREIEKAEEIAEEAKQEVEAEEAAA